MTREEIRQKAVECGKAFETMCVSKEYETDEELNTICHCEYYGFGEDVSCPAMYGYEHGFADGVEEGKRETTWIPVTEKLPECEQTVLITVEHRPFGGKPYRRVTKAFYEDGNMNTEDSGCCWDVSSVDWEYDEESDGYIIPEGWWEDTDYCEVLGIVGDFVLAWMPLPEPYREGEET